METMPKSVALYCQSCQRLIAVVPVRRFDRVYVPSCQHCETRAEKEAAVVMVIDEEDENV